MGLSAGILIPAMFLGNTPALVASNPRIRFQMLWACLLMLGCRVGEAANPGPPVATFGVCDPTGISSKLDVISNLEGDSWVIAETHLTRLGLEKFNRGLKALRSPYQSAVAGAPCKPTKSDDTGEYSGVMLIHRGPARALQHSFPKDHYASGRIQIAGMLVHNVWIQVAMIYGVPKSAKHQLPSYQTDCLLQSLVDRLSASSGPRILCGDVNHTEEELSQLRRLRSMGFREIQEVASFKFGQAERPTTRGSAKLDQIWVSAELLDCVEAVHVFDDHWADHSAVQMTFRVEDHLRYAEVWHKPQSFPWPSKWDSTVGWDRTCDPTVAYAQMWRSWEKDAVVQVEHECGSWNASQLGRGQTLTTRKVQYQVAPLKASRTGELVPEFLGVARRHSLWFKQLRRLQSLLRTLRKDPSLACDNAAQNVNLTWDKCCRAPGFDGSFAQWWSKQKLQPCLSSVPCDVCPPLDVVEAVFGTFQSEVRRYEQALKAYRIKGAKAKRQQSLHHVFADCRDPFPLPVDTLSDRREACVDEVDSDQCAVVLERAAGFDETKPLVQATTVPELENAWSALENFTAAVDLEIDEAKTFAWSAQRSERKELRRGRLRVQLHAKALGVHHNFSKRHGNCTVQQRIVGMTEVWIRLRNSLSPYRHKVKALVSLGWPRALHGIAAVSLGQSHFTTLRAAAAKGIRSNRKGSNPALRLSSHGLQVDPHSWAILQTLRDARDFAADQRFSADIVHVAAGAARTNGPIGVLVERLDQLGWQLVPGGLFRDGLGDFDPLRCSWEEVLLRVRLSWPGVLGGEVLHRSSFDGLHNSDLGELERALRQYEDSDQALLRCHVDGTLYTENGRAHISADASNACPWCGQQDGFFHRAWVCRHFEPDRAEVPPEIMTLVQSLPRSVTCHCWPQRVPELNDLLQKLAGLSVPTSFPVLQAGTCHNLFLDGSCHNPTEPCLRLAAWAVTWASPDLDSVSHDLLHVGHVPGFIQTSYRAELWAAIAALRIVVGSQCDAVLWSDNQSVVKGLRKLLNGGKRLKPNKPQSDLWDQLFHLVSQLRTGQVRVNKVQAHGDWKLATTPVEQWAFWHNGLVDRAANRGNDCRPVEFMQCWQKASDALQHSRHVMKHVFQVHLRTAKRSLNTRTQQASVEHPAEVSPAAEPGAASTLPTEWGWSPAMVRLLREGNLRQVHRWWTELVVPGFGSENRLRWVSGAQLYVWFTMVGGIGPRYIYRSWYDPTWSAPPEYSHHGILDLLELLPDEVNEAWDDDDDFNEPAPVGFTTVKRHCDWVKTIEYGD
eukprot:Skav202801  [mRNA]  locus=scaffold326:826914:834457:- [translate_table: standard]